jgi:hypothetical protein
MPDDNASLTVPIKCIQRALRRIEANKNELANIPELETGIPDEAVVLRDIIEAQETQLKLLFDAGMLETIRTALPKRHVLQTILESLFECSAGNGNSAKRGDLIVHGDLGDIMAQVLRHTTEENRKELIDSINWVEILPEGFVAFPYVTYTETP